MFVPWTVLPGTPYTCLTSLLQKAGMVKIWLQWNWAFCGTFFPLPVVQITYNLHGFRMKDLMSHKFFFKFAVWQFFDQSCCGGRFKIELNFGVSKYFWDFHFFSFVTRIFHRLQLLWTNTGKDKLICFYFYLRWRNFPIVFPRSNKKNWVFLQTFESNGSFFTRRNSELGLDFAIIWERNIDFPKTSSERVELCFFC